MDHIIDIAAYVGKKLAYSAIHPSSMVILGLSYTYGGVPYVCGWAAYSLIYY